MKTVATYNGKVVKLNAPPQASPVILTEVATGKVVETGAVTETLISAGLQTDDEFEVLIQQSLDGSTGGIIRKKGTEDGTSFDI